MTMLQDEKTYMPITDKRRSPTSKTTDIVQQKLLELKKAGFIKEEIHKQLRPTNPVPALFYGLPKVHKVQLTENRDHLIFSINIVIRYDCDLSVPVLVHQRTLSRNI